MSTSPSSLFGRRTGRGLPDDEGPRHRHLFVKILLGLIVFVAVVVAALSWYASTPQFANKVRTELIKVLEDSTGGKVELGAFRWRLLHLEFEADNLTIHGLEAPGEVPYAHLDRLRVQVKIISFFRAKVGLNYLGIDKPVAHLIVYKDGSTNQPVPKKKSSTPTDLNSTINQVFDLAADRAEINDGTALINQQAIPFALAANDLEVGINYLPTTDQYKASLSIADLTARRAIAAPIHSKLSVAAVMGRNNLDVSDLQFTAGASTLAAHASVSNFADPHWQASAKGTVDLREAEALAAVPGLDRGVIRLDVAGKGTKALFSLDGTAAIAGATYRGSGVNLSGLDATTKIHVDQDLLAATDLRAHLHSGGTVLADAHIEHWLAPSTPPSSAPVVTTNAKVAATTRAAQEVNRAVANATSNAPAKAQVSQGAVNAKLQGFTLPSILSIVAPPKYQHLGFFTTANGTLKLNWTGNASDLAADARIALSAPAALPSGDVPVNGIIDVTYAGRSNSLLVHQLDAHTPGTQLNVTGGVGLAAGSRSSLQTQLTVTNLAEFNKAFAALGVGGKQGASALPVALHGQASFHGLVTGNLAAPDVTGHLAVYNFDLLLANTPAATTAPAAVANATQPTGPDGKTVPVPAAMTAQPGTPTAFHIDSLTADAEYSPALISVQSALITRGKTQVHASGQLHAHRTRRKGYVFDNDAAIQGTASINDANVPDLLALAGQSTLPVTGVLNLNVNVGGTLGNLGGGGRLVVNGGQVYGEPYKSLTADLSFAGQDVGASQFTFLVGGGQIAGNGGYNLTSKRFHFQTQASGLNLDNFQALKKSPLLVHGNLAFNAQGEGTVEAPTVQAALHLTNLAVASPAGGPASTGEIDLTAHTAAGDLIADLDARLSGAEAKLHAQTSLSGDYTTQAKLTLANLDINPFLQLFNVQGVKGSSIIAGDVTISGPLAKPKQLNGDAELSKISVTAQGVTVATDGGLRLSLREGIAQLQPVRITGPGTDLHAEGRAALFGTDRLLDAQANGSLNLSVAKTFDKDLNTTGNVTFHFTATRTIEHPDLEGSVDFHDANLAYGDFPNGLNHLNGSLVFDQGRLSVSNLKGTSGGGDVTLGGFISYQQGVYADLSILANQVRVRYPSGISTVFNSKIRVQGTQQNILVSGGVLITRFSISPGLDASAFSSNGISPPPDPTAFGNHIRLDVHVTSSPQLDINNTYAKLAGDVDLFVRGTAAEPSVLGHVSITEGDATFAGTHYVLQHGDIYFTNPVRIEPTIDLEASAHVEDYDVIIGLHGTASKLTPTFRSEPPLSEQDIFSLLALGRTQEEQQIYSQQQSAAGVNSTADSLLGGALNATLSSRINKLFGGGSVKIDPTFISGTGNSTARITVQQQVSKNGTVMYATNVNSTAQQLIQGQYNLTPNVAIVAVRDEAGVFSMQLKLHQRYR
ncbi:translocation/assembly module TamB domain-containing protein [Acidipila sp. EB88]|uniref:translocation/assembly module TamB domain-containing protein n=1 Tax=Acidipila sp. EB88 TaxID=2305226 RepID=UPI000F5F8A02|nr:translocation/assembly module TamB domain-containing protein [Acidipila sp. EB88]RRA47292.1 translocation/assembly module TamB [Acidipila sp. EB88]